MRSLDAAQIRAATPWPDLIETIADVVVADSVLSPDRHVHPVGLPDGVAGTHPGRRTSEEITLFQSAGFASADLAAARLAILHGRA